MHSLAEKMYSYLQRLNKDSWTNAEYDDDGEIFAKLELVKLIRRSLLGYKLTKLGEIASLGDINNFVTFYQLLVLQDPALFQDHQNDRSKEDS